MSPASNVNVNKGMNRKSYRRMITNRMRHEYCTGILFHWDKISVVFCPLAVPCFFYSQHRWELHTCSVSDYILTHAHSQHQAFERHPKLWNYNRLKCIKLSTHSQFRSLSERSHLLSSTSMYKNSWKTILNPVELLTFSTTCLFILFNLLCEQSQLNFKNRMIIILVLTYVDFRSLSSFKQSLSLMTGVV